MLAMYVLNNKMDSYLNKFRLDNKLSFVIGSEGLIGKKVVEYFVSAGSNVICIDKKINKNLIKNCTFAKFDISKINFFEKNYKKILNKYGVPDVFINCSYPYTSDYPSNDFANITFKSFRKNIDIHLNTFSWFAKLTAESMKENKINGSLIQLGSIYGFLGQDLSIYKNTQMKENMSYSIIKGGIINLTRQIASYYGKFNIRINTLSPGGIKGPVAGKSKTQNKEFIKNYSSRNPMKRLGKPEEIATVALFLASDASSYINGINLVVDGGWSSI